MYTRVSYTPQLFCPITTTEEEIILQNRISVIHQVLAPSDCQNIIESLESGLERASTATHLRSNQRQPFSSPMLSSQIYSQIRQFLNPIILTEDDNQQTGNGYKLTGVWEPSYIDSNWMFSKYNPGTHFGPHYDGATVKNIGERSLQTIIIYLNVGCVGGATNFFDDNKQGMDPIDNNNLFVGSKDFVIRSISPTQGSALVFHHYLLHEGELLTEGNKYILRSDIFYKRENTPDMEPLEKEAIDWMIKGQQFEFEKNYPEATKCYKKAYRLYPEIEGKNIEL